MWHRVGFIFLALLALSLGFASIVGLRAWWVARHPISFTPTASTFQFAPPEQALVGHLTWVAGDVTKLPRDSTVSAQLALGDQILVGETVTTSAGTASLELAPGSVATLSANSELVYSAGLPTSLLLVQNQGTIDYTSVGDNPLSIRSWHALIAVKNGTARLSLFPVTHLARLSSLGGEVEVAMIDKNNQTNLFTLLPTQTVMINDLARTLTLLKPAPTKKIVRTR